MDYDEAVKIVAEKRVNPGSDSLKEEDALYLYGRYKAITDGKCTMDKSTFLKKLTSPKTSLYNDAKYKSWKEQEDRDVETLKQEYVERVMKLKA